MTLNILGRIWIFIPQVACQVFFVMFSLEYEQITVFFSCIIKVPFITGSFYNPHNGGVSTNQNIVPWLRIRKNLRKRSSIRICTQLSNSNIKGKKPFKFRNMDLGGIAEIINFRPLVFQEATSYNLFHNLIKLNSKCSSLFLSPLLFQTSLYW